MRTIKYGTTVITVDSGQPCEWRGESDVLSMQSGRDTVTGVQWVKCPASRAIPNAAVDTTLATLRLSTSLSPTETRRRVIAAWHAAAA